LTAPRAPILVRDAGPGDGPSIVEFNAALARETESKELDLDVLSRGVASALADPGRLRYWVAEALAPGRVVGQAGVTREWSDWRDGWVWWFQSVYVHPDARSLGVFRALHAHIRSAAIAAGDVVGLRLYVEHANQRAQRTYEALGMRHGGYHVFEEFWPSDAAAD
jgi:GNAT superfamily N-acetyltransferase